MSAAKEFPPEKVRAIVSEVASLLKERKESVSVAETVGVLFSLALSRFLLQAPPYVFCYLPQGRLECFLFEKVILFLW